MDVASEELMRLPLTYIELAKEYKTYSVVKIKQDDNSWDLGLAFTNGDETFVRDARHLDPKFIIGEVELVSFNELTDKDIVVGYGTKGIYTKIDTSTGLYKDDIEELSQSMGNDMKYLRVTSRVFLSKLTSKTLSALKGIS